MGKAALPCGACPEAVLFPRPRHWMWIVWVVQGVNVDQVKGEHVTYAHFKNLRNYFGFREVESALKYAHLVHSTARQGCFDRYFFFGRIGIGGCGRGKLGLWHEMGSLRVKGCEGGALE